MMLETNVGKGVLDIYTDNYNEQDGNKEKGWEELNGGISRL